LLWGREQGLCMPTTLRDYDIWYDIYAYVLYPAMDLGVEYLKEERKRKKDPIGIAC
jgi:hypothetical protein